MPLAPVIVLMSARHFFSVVSAVLLALPLVVACSGETADAAVACAPSGREDCDDGGVQRDVAFDDAGVDSGAGGCADERSTCSPAAGSWTCVCRFARDVVTTRDTARCIDALVEQAAVCPEAPGERAGPACAGFDGTVSELPWVIALYNDARASGAPVWLAMTLQGNGPSYEATLQPLGVESPWGDADAARQRRGAPGSGTFTVEDNGRFALMIDGFDVGPGVLPADWSTDTWRISGELEGTLLDGWTGCGDGYLQIATRAGVETLRFDVAARSTSIDPQDLDAEQRSCSSPLGGCDTL